MRKLGITLLAIGLACLSYVGWQVWGTDLVSTHHYATIRQRIEASWPDANPVPNPAPTTPPEKSAKSPAHRVPTGSLPALVSIPAIGVDRVPILQGIGEDVLAQGVGHYPHTALPGQVGNFAIAGHRITHGQPFANLEKLAVGDQVIVSTRQATFTYTVDAAPADLTVPDTDATVLRAKPGVRQITLTTCTDLFHSNRRSVGYGHLTGWTPRPEGATR